MLVTMGYTHDDVAKMIKDVEDARESLLGSRPNRVTNKGYAEFELHPRAEPLNNAKRCYGLNNMVQRQKRLSSTPRSLKTYDDDRDPYQMMINLFCIVSPLFPPIFGPVFTYMVSRLRRS